MPRLRDPKSRAAFERLVSTRAWFQHDGKTFGANSAEITSFFATAKGLILTLASLGAADEVVAMSVFSLEVGASIIDSASGFVAGLGGDQTARREGLETMRFGLAISTGSLFELALNASHDLQVRAYAWLTDSKAYRQVSQPGLQLLLATIDGRSSRPEYSAHRADLARVRAVIAAEFGRRPVPNAGERVTYQGLPDSTSVDNTAGTVVSETGHFAVDQMTGAIAKHVQTDLAGGGVRAGHWIELQLGDVRFEAVCLDGTTEAALATNFAGMSGVERDASDLPGQWFSKRDSKREARIRTLSVDGRGCVVSAEGPPGQLPEARVQAFLSSLRAVPRSDISP